ncbi:MAG: S41 family peptidase [Candidatus Gottesmanbacteria bacterium]
MKTLPFSKIRIIILAVAVCILTGGIGYRLGERQAFSKPTLTTTSVINQDVPSTNRVDFALFWDVWQRLRTYYIDAGSMDSQRMVWGAISGMVNSLEDPYTVFLPPKENKEFKEDIGGSFQGIGAQLGLVENKIIIQAPIKGSPAEKAGLKSMDWIMKVNDEETVGWTLNQAVSKIRGTKGTKVTLTILHDKSQKPAEISIIRDEIVVPSVEHWVKIPSEITGISGIASPDFLSSKKYIGYMYLSRFGDRTNEEWLAAVDDTIAKLTALGAKGLIFDLRNNPGGYLDGSVFIASEFVKSGVVVTQTNSDGTKETLSVNRKGKLTDIPLVVLINKGSASAAEIVAGALKDHKRAIIVGEKSFGKGSVQTPQELSGGSGLHITTGKWLLPNGDWIHKKGITPDFEVKLESTEATHDAQLLKAVELLLQ